MIYVDASKRDLDKLFNDYNIQESIDTLHKVVNDAKERKSRGEDGKDTWKDNLDPKVAVCARTVPVLNSEARRLRKLIAEVPCFPLHLKCIAVSYPFIARN